MKVKYTPLNDIEQWLSSESSDGIINEMKYYHKRLDAAFQVLFDLPIKLTDDAMLQFLQLDGFESDFRKFLMTSGILPCFDWEDWTEGIELVNGERILGCINPVKALKLLYLIIKLDEQQNGKFERCLKNGKILFLMEQVLTFNSRI